jgi:hypothetical protein
MVTTARHSVGLQLFVPGNLGPPFASLAKFHIRAVRDQCCGAPIALTPRCISVAKSKAHGYWTYMLSIAHLMSLHQSLPIEPVHSVKYTSLLGKASWNVSWFATAPPVVER